MDCSPCTLCTLCIDAADTIHTAAQILIYPNTVRRHRGEGDRTGTQDHLYRAVYRAESCVAACGELGVLLSECTQ